jgi:hypothetical protein
MVTFLRALKTEMKKHIDKSPEEYQKISSIGNFEAFVQVYDSWRPASGLNKQRLEFRQAFYDFIPEYGFILRSPEEVVENELIKVLSAKSWDGKTGFVGSPFELIKSNVLMHDTMGMVIRLIRVNLFLKEHLKR